jgi:hypothetical protein
VKVKRKVKLVISDEMRNNFTEELVLDFSLEKFVQFDKGDRKNIPA